jgi:hypothetical protein
MYSPMVFALQTEKKLDFGTVVRAKRFNRKAGTLAGA